MNEAMVNKRKAMHLSIRDMARACECSQNLIWMLEYGDNITHPHIAARIADKYGLSVDEYNQIGHKNRQVTELPKPAPAPGNGESWVERSRKMKLANCICGCGAQVEGKSKSINLKRRYDVDDDY